MSIIAGEIICTIIGIISYLIFWTQNPLQTSILIYASVALMFVRICYSKKYKENLIETRLYMLPWGIIHGVIVGIALLRNILGGGFWAAALGVVLGCIIGGVYALILFMGIEYDFDNYDGEDVSRIFAYSMTFETFALEAMFLFENFTVLKVALVLATIVFAMIIVETKKYEAEGD